VKTVKFAVWGMGIRGKKLIQKLGNRIVCIIESNCNLWHTYYESIPVIPCEAYEERYSMYPVIITPLGFESEIMEKLAQKGIVNAFSYSENLYLFDAYAENVFIENYVRRFEADREIIIYGGGLPGYLLYNYLTEKKYGCRLALQSNDRGYLSEGVERVEWKKEAVEGAQVILTVPLTENDRTEIRGIEVSCEKYYETFWKYLRDFYYDPRLERFRNIHHGKRCFIVATGPSLKMEDLDRLHQKQEICISVNGIFAAFDRTQWRPDYYMVGDHNAVSKWKKEILEEKKRIRFVAKNVASVLDETDENLYQWHVFRDWAEGKQPQFSDDFARGTFCGWTITYDGALQLAVYMGFSEIYLLGVDCNYAKGSCRNYFEKQKESDELNHHEERMILAYRAAREYAEEHNIRIYNATRGGMLEEFERVDFDSLMREG